jgi:hypothetical protein
MIVALLVVCNRNITSFCVSVNVLNKLKVLIGHYFIIRSSLTENNTYNIHLFAATFLSFFLKVFNLQGKDASSQQVIGSNLR